MKYIHSIWSKPATNDNFDNKFDVKYLSKNFYSYLLSALLIKKMGHSIELYCDKNSEEMYSMIPYDKINVVDYESDGVDSKFWIWGKIKTHILMNEPYIHIDGDVFLFRDILNEKYDNKHAAVVQSLENDKTVGGGFDNVYLKSTIPFPDGKYDINWKKYNYEAYNCGVVGFNDMKLKNIYANKVKEILVDLSTNNDFDDNRKKYDGMFLIAEQSLLLYLLKEYNANIYEVIPYDEIKERNYDWYSLATEKGYCHMWGYSKYREDVIDKIKYKVFRYFSEYSDVVGDFEAKFLN